MLPLSQSAIDAVQLCAKSGPSKVICLSGTSVSPTGQPDPELDGRMRWGIVRFLVPCAAQPNVGAFAPGYPAKKFSKLRFS